MKLIHCADIHLGAMGKNLSGEVAEKRRRELRDTFNRLALYAVENEIPVVLMCGDIFDTDNVSREERKEFYSVIKKYPYVDFLYLRGNHDRGELDLSLVPDNMKLFSNSWTKYSYGNVDIYGLEFTEDNVTSAPLSLEVDKSKFNIVMLHGTIDDDICVKDYATKGIDYMALGHIHTFESGKIDGRGIYVYSGCLEGRGFDETGDKGFVLLDTSSGVDYSFLRFAKRTIFNREIDVSDCENAYLAGDFVMDELSDISSDDGVRVVLRGEVRFDRERLISEVGSRLKDKFFISEVKNETTPYTDIDTIKSEISLRGRFVSMVLSNEELDENEKKEIIFNGLKSLGN